MNFGIFSRKIESAPFLSLLQPKIGSLAFKYFWNLVSILPFSYTHMYDNLLLLQNYPNGLLLYLFSVFFSSNEFLSPF